MKRKRAAPTPDEATSPITTSDEVFEQQKDELSATHVLASRNFPRTSATLTNDISAHKLASIFAKPITDREAPRYHSLIHRPQDLKSIKQAIANGNRALTAAFEARDLSFSSSSDPSNIIVIPAGGRESDARVWIRKSEDVVPPKGIVNSSQLEKELVRVFANAIMFNPDPNRGVGPAFRTRARKRERHVPAEISGVIADDDEGRGDEGGVVRDAREMFGDVERMIGEWRAAERAAEEGRDTGAGGSGAGDRGIWGGSSGQGRRGQEAGEEEPDELAGEENEGGAVQESVGERAGKRRKRG